MKLFYNVDKFKQILVNVVRTITTAQWFMTNGTIDRHLKASAVLIVQRVRVQSTRHCSRFEVHSSPLAVNFPDNSRRTYRLKRSTPQGMMHFD